VKRGQGEEGKEKMSGIRYGQGSTVQSLHNKKKERHPDMPKASKGKGKEKKEKLR